MANGIVTICGLAPERKDLTAGNLKEESLKDVWINSLLFNKLRNLNVEKIAGICNICPFLYACGGSCRLTPIISSCDYYAPDNFCQAYYTGLMNKDINETDFPSKAVSLGLIELN